MIRFLQTPTLAKKVVLGAILLFISVMMVVTLIPGTGVSDYFGSAPTEAGLYATVDEERVLTTDVQQRAQMEARRRGYPQQFVPLLLPQVAEQVVLEKAMLAEARRLGLMVTDDELRDELRNGGFAPQLFPKGQWVGKEKYEAYVQQQLGYGVPEFERALKDYLLNRKLTTLVQASASVSDDELQKEFVKQNVRVRFDYAVVTPDSIARQVSATEPELRKFYEERKESLKDSIPAERKVKYVLVDPARLLAQAKPAPEELQRYYNERRDQFRVPDEVDVRHILVATPEGADQKALDAARAKAEALLQQLKGGADFAALAKKESDDPGSAADGGKIGWIRRDSQLVPEFKTAAFALNQGETSGLVKSQFGFHIIRADGKKAAHQQTLDEVRDQIEPIVANEKAQRLAEQAANNVLSAAKSQGLDAAAAKSGMNVVTTDFFNQSAALPGIGNAPEFMAAAFAANEKTPPQLARSQQGWVVFQVAAAKPARTPSFEEARAQLEAQYRQERSSALLAQRTQELADRARSLYDLKRAARELGAEFRSSELVGANSQVPEIGQVNNVEAVFTMKPGQISGPIPAGRNGVIIALRERQEPSVDQLAGQRESLREELLQRKRSQAVGAFGYSVRQRMEQEGKIKYNQAEKERLSKGGLNLGS